MAVHPYVEHASSLSTKDFTRLHVLCWSMFPTTDFWYILAMVHDIFSSFPLAGTRCRPCIYGRCTQSYCWPDSDNPIHVTTIKYRILSPSWSKVESKAVAHKSGSWPTTIAEYRICSPLKNHCNVTRCWSHGTIGSLSMLLNYIVLFPTRQCRPLVTQMFIARSHRWPPDVCRPLHGVHQSRWWWSMHWGEGRGQSSTAVL